MLVQVYLLPSKVNSIVHIYNTQLLQRVDVFYNFTLFIQAIHNNHLNQDMDNHLNQDTDKHHLNQVTGNLSLDMVNLSLVMDNLHQEAMDSLNQDMGNSHHKLVIINSHQDLHMANLLPNQVMVNSHLHNRVMVNNHLLNKVMASNHHQADPLNQLAQPNHHQPLHRHHLNLHHLLLRYSA